MLLRKEEAIETQREGEREQERERGREKDLSAEYLLQQKAEETGRPLLLGHVVHPAVGAGLAAAAAAAALAAAVAVAVVARRSLLRLLGILLSLIPSFFGV